jgi:polynucleotide 5'-hydroxyl-kinase GRC3/NOL9
VYGALWPASEAIYRFYAPHAYAVPPIEVLSSVAEIELTSLEEGLPTLAKLQGKNIWGSPIGADTTKHTFFVVRMIFKLDPSSQLMEAQLGHHFTMDPTLVRLQELDTASWHSALSQLSTPPVDELAGKPKLSRTLISGKRWAGRSTFARCLINRLLSLRDDSGFLKHPEGVVFIDADQEFPEFSPPGTFALVRVKELLLGPAFTHPAPTTEVTKMHLAAGLDSRVLGPELVMILQDLIHTEQERFGNRHPVVISVPAWFDPGESDLMNALWKALRVTELVQMESSSSPFEALAALDSIPVRHISPIPVDTSLSAIDDVDLRLQSYFHASKPSGGHLQWTELPLPAMASARNSLSLGQHHDALVAVLLLDPLVDTEDIVDALLGSIGAIVVVSKEYFDRELRQHVECPQNSLPRLIAPTPQPISPVESECLGLAYVAEVQVNPVELVIYTPIPEAVLQDAKDRVLVMVHAGRKKTRWTGSDWIAKEYEAMAT